MKSSRSSQGGSALLLVIVVTLLVVGIGASYLALTGASSVYTEQDVAGLHALYCAETGAAVAIAAINSDQIVCNGPVTEDLPPEAQDGVWTPDEHATLVGRFGNGYYLVTLTLWGYDDVDSNGDGDPQDVAEQNYVTVTATGVVPEVDVGTPDRLAADWVNNPGRVRGLIRQVECIVSRTPGANSIFKHALYAGNDSNDVSPNNYAITLKGRDLRKGTNADAINGDVYVNGDFALTEDAQVTGSVKVTPGHTVTGTGNFTNGTLPPYDIQGMEYGRNHDVNVVANFEAGLAAGRVVDDFANAPGNTRDAGGKATQFRPPGKKEAEDPAHIFRKHPDDRRWEWEAKYDKAGRLVSGTVGDDYFMEDPYETCSNDTNWDGKDAAAISLTQGFTGDDTKASVYYLGKDKENTNLWIHNYETYGFKLNSPGAATHGSKTIFVVKGDIYISDNLHYLNDVKDIMVFIAMKNEDGTGGNICLGDPKFGTVEKFNCMMYAENDFVVTNLSEGNDKAVNSKIVVSGNMAAGNQFINKLDQGGAHHRLEVTLDRRIAEGSMPEVEKFLPKNPSEKVAEGNYQIMSWRQVPPGPAVTHGPAYK